MRGWGWWDSQGTGAWRLLLGTGLGRPKMGGRKSEDPGPDPRRLEGKIGIRGSARRLTESRDGFLRLQVEWVALGTKASAAEL